MTKFIELLNDYGRSNATPPVPTPTTNNGGSPESVPRNLGDAVRAATGSVRDLTTGETLHQPGSK